MEFRPVETSKSYGPCEASTHAFAELDFERTIRLKDDRVDLKIQVSTGQFLDVEQVTLLLSKKRGTCNEHEYGKKLTH